MRAVQHDGDHALSGRVIGDSLTDGPHHSGALVPHDVRPAREDAASAMQRVAALDADRLHLDEHEPGPACRIGHVLVAQHVWAARLVVDRRLHGRRPYPEVAGRVDGLAPLTSSPKAFCLCAGDQRIGSIRLTVPPCMGPAFLAKFLTL